jgi:hypothetical protein
VSGRSRTRSPEAVWQLPAASRPETGSCQAARSDALDDRHIRTESERPERTEPGDRTFQNHSATADTPVVKTFRTLRTFGSTMAFAIGLAVALFAGQDLWHYWQAISRGWTEWAASGQGLWQLTCGLAEVAATAALVVLGVRLLGSKRTPPGTELPA